MFCVLTENRHGLVEKFDVVVFIVELWIGASDQDGHVVVVVVSQLDFAPNLRSKICPQIEGQ